MGRCRCRCGDGRNWRRGGHRMRHPAICPFPGAKQCVSGKGQGPPAPVERNQPVGARGHERPVTSSGCGRTCSPCLSCVERWCIGHGHRCYGAGRRGCESAGADRQSALGHLAVDPWPGGFGPAVHTHRARGTGATLEDGVGAGSQPDAPGNRTPGRCRPLWSLPRRTCRSGSWHAGR